MADVPDPFIIGIYGDVNRARTGFAWFAALVLAGQLAELAIAAATGNRAFAIGLALSAMPVAAALALIRAGRLEPAGAIVALDLVLSVTALASFGLGVHDVSLISFPVAMVLASLLVRPLLVGALGLVAVGCLAWLVFGELAGLYAPVPLVRSIPADFFSTSILTGMAAAAGLVLVRSLVRTRRRLDAELAERRAAEARAAALLAENELILREAHHRIKNHMATVHSVLLVEADRPAVGAARGALIDSAGRVAAMMKLYDKLYRSGRVGELPLRAYLADVAAGVRLAFPDRAGVAIEVGGDDLILEAATVALLGIIVNELLANSLKYAFPGRSDGRIEIAAERRDAAIALRYADDGVGLPAGYDQAAGSGFGMELVRGISSQLGGTLAVGPGPGARFELAFPAGRRQQEG
jgi:two-component sensor histidine kinase